MNKLISIIIVTFLLFIACGNHAMSTEDLSKSVQATINSNIANDTVGLDANGHIIILSQLIKIEDLTLIKTANTLGFYDLAGNVFEWTTGNEYSGVLKINTILWKAYLHNIMSNSAGMNYWDLPPIIKKALSYGIGIDKQLPDIYTSNIVVIYDGEHFEYKIETWPF